MTTRVQVTEHSQGDVRRRPDRLVTEEPMEVRCSWPGRPAVPVAVTMRTPGHDFELAAGLSFAEGLIGGDGRDWADRVTSVAYCADLPPGTRQDHNVVTVSLSVPPAVEPRQRTATVTAASSACGVCGADSVDAVVERLGPGGATLVSEARTVPVEVVHGLPDALRDQQRVFGKTGGLHAAGLVDAEGDVEVVREDVGRHNAVDKVIGHRLLAARSPSADVLAVSGRLGYEIVQKAVVAAIPVVVAVGAPSSLSVELAQRAGVTLIGFADTRRFVVYSHPDRVSS